MSKRLTNKVAIVTGGGRGIGRAIVEQYALEDARVVITDILDAEIEALSAELNARAGAEVTAFHHLDVRDAATWQSVIALATSKFGGLDILVNNAGYLAQSDAVNCSEEEWDKILDTNMKGPFLGIKYSVPELRKRGGGSIVNIASIATARTVPMHGAYAAAKNAMVSMSKYLAVENARYNVRVNVAAPGMIDTESLRWSFGHDDDAAAAVEERIPMGRFGNTDEMASAILFFASDEASYITGQYLLVDGGKGDQLIV